MLLLDWWELENMTEAEARKTIMDEARLCRNQGMSADMFEQMCEEQSFGSESVKKALSLTPEIVPHVVHFIWFPTRRDR